MNKLTTLFVFLLAIAHSSLAFSDAVAGFDSKTISLNQTVTLTVRSSSMSRSIQPDLSEVYKHFEETNRQTSTRIQSINGRTASVSEWYIQLLPRTKGVFKFSGISVGNDTTGPLSIEVIADTNNSATPGANYFVTASVDDTTPYVQQMMLLTVDIASRVTLRNWNPPELQIEGVRIQPLQYGQSEKQHLGHTYVVHHLRYALFPQRSGTLTIPSIRYSATMAEPSRRSLAVMSRPGRRVIMSSESFEVEVQAQPTTATLNWLPSPNVAISLHHRNRPPFEAGDELVFNLDLMANDLLPEQIPSFVIPKIDGLSIYVEPEKRSLVETKTGIMSRLEQTLRVVPNGGGDFTIPPFTANWYSTQRDTPMESATTAYQFSVEGPPFEPSTNAPAPLAEVISDEVTQALKPEVVDDNEQLASQLPLADRALNWVRDTLSWVRSHMIESLIVAFLAALCGLIYFGASALRHKIWYSQRAFYQRLNSWAQNEFNSSLVSDNISASDQKLLHRLSLGQIELTLSERRALVKRLEVSLDVDSGDHALSQLNLYKSAN